MSSLASAFVTREALVGRTGRGGTDALSELVERAREGDGRAFDRLMLETQEQVLGVAWRLLGSREDARDAAQEAYVRVFRHLPRFRAGHDFRAWLYRITVNVCRDAARRRRRFPTAPVSPAAPEPAEEARAEQDLLGSERRARLLEALVVLSPRERAALVLRDLEGLSSEQVARVLGSRPGTVRGQVASARLKIRRFCLDLIAGEKGGAR